MCFARERPRKTLLGHRVRLGGQIKRVRESGSASVVGLNTSKCCLDSHTHLNTGADVMFEKNAGAGGTCGLAASIDTGAGGHAEGTISRPVCDACISWWGPARGAYQYFPHLGLSTHITVKILQRVEE